MEDVYVQRSQSQQFNLRELNLNNLSLHTVVKLIYVKLCRFHSFVTEIKLKNNKTSV